MKNIVYIACSLDGYIADKDGGLGWLPQVDGAVYGFDAFMASIDAIVMGRNTFETVVGFGGEWPYSKPVFVVSTTLKSISIEYDGKVELISGDPKDIQTYVNLKGHKNLYIDGGKTIQRFLQAELIDEMIITTIPVLLGGGSSLFGSLETPQNFKLKELKDIGYGLAQSHYKKV